MCGLVGVITKSKFGLSNTNTEQFTNMLYCDALRGWDSTGTYLVNKHGDVQWIKNKHNPLYLIATKEYKEYMSDAFKEGIMLIGHNRKATLGGISDETAHPFVEDNIILVHNGTIQNHKKHADTDVDSHAIACLIKEKGHEQAIKEIDGAFALIWYDINTRQMHLARNKERPLFLCETSDAWYIASEEKMLHWLLERNTMSAGIKQTIDLKPGTCYTFDLKDTDTFTTGELELFTPKKSLPSQALHGPTCTTGSSTKRTTIQTDTTLGAANGALPTFTLGDEITFDLDDFTGKEKYGSSFIWDGILKGTWNDDQNVQVRCMFLNEHWKEISDANKISGKIDRIILAGNKQYIWLMPGTLKVAWELLSRNGIIVDSTMWDNLPHTCDRCKAPVQFFEVEDGIVTYKKNRKKVICPKCTSALEDADHRGRKKIRVH